LNQGGALRPPKTARRPGRADIDFDEAVRLMDDRSGIVLEHETA
jgi:hypothetical protein